MNKPTPPKNRIIKEGEIPFFENEMNDSEKMLKLLEKIVTNTLTIAYITSIIMGILIVTMLFK